MVRLSTKHRDRLVRLQVINVDRGSSAPVRCKGMEEDGELCKGQVGQGNYMYTYVDCSRCTGHDEIAYPQSHFIAGWIGLLIRANRKART